MRIGGDADMGSAGTLNVVATSDGGGRLLMEGADLELRADRIAVGLGTGLHRHACSRPEDWRRRCN